MIVVHSCTSSSFSGLENYVLDLAHWQYRNGKAVMLFCREGSELSARARERGLPVWEIGSQARPGPVLWAKMRGEWKKRFAAGPVFLHMHAGGELLYHMPWIAPLTRPSSLIKTILHFHIWINHRKMDPLHRLLYAGVDEVWTSSETSRAHLATLLPVDRTQIRVVPYGRDVQALLDSPRDKWRIETRRRLGVRDDEILAVCISRLEPIKGVGELFDAFAKVAPKYPKAHLAIVGDASPKNEEAERFADDLRARHAALRESVRRRLHLPGFISPCEPVMAGADFYVLPSYEECMSLAMLDAVILGLPILGTNTGGTPSVARPNESGMLVPPRNSAALAEGLGAFYGDPELVQKLSEGARTLGLAFNQENIFGQIWNWYQAPRMS